MRIPKLSVNYSYIYDEIFHNFYRKKFTKKHKKEGYIYAKKLQKEWDKTSNKIFKTISEVSGLKWKRYSIQCFVVKYVPYPFSHPLTLDMNRNFYYQKAMLIHELTHILLVQNSSNLKKLYNLNGKIYRKYKKENINTKIHLPVHAIVKLTLEKVFGKEAKKYIKYETWFYSKHSIDYIRSWEIVKKEGAKNIIEDVLK